MSFPPTEKCFVIAEIGSNHDGDFDEAIRHMDVAATAGADAVKFQSFLADHLVREDSPGQALVFEPIFEVIE